MLLSIILLCTPTPSYQSMTGKKLVEYLLQNASRSTLPVIDSTSSVKVILGFELVHIVSIVESEQTMNAKVWLRMEWVNEMMRWNPAKWGNIKKTHLNYEDTWTPDIFLKEDVSEDISTGPEKYKTQIQCHPDGRQQWLIPVLLKSSCTFNIEYFPYDRQKCYLRFNSWTHSQKEVDMHIDPRPVVKSNYVKSPEWSLVSVTSEKIMKTYDCCPDPFVDILYTLIIDRRPMYYIYNAVIPCLIQMIIILFSFFLPAESGERIGVVITVLLVFAVYLELVSGNLPKTSSSIPTLSLYYIWSMAASSCSLIATCVVLVVHFKGLEKGAPPIPNLARKLLYSKMGKIFCITQNVSNDCNEPLLSCLEKGNHKETLQQNGSYKIDKLVKGITHIKNTESEGGGTDMSRLIDDAISRLIDEVRAIAKVIQDQEDDDTIEKEWQMLAKLLDRIFFFIFLYIFIVITLAILLPAYIHYNAFHK